MSSNDWGYQPERAPEEEPRERRSRSRSATEPFAEPAANDTYEPDWARFEPPSMPAADHQQYASTQQGSYGDQAEPFPLTDYDRPSVGDYPPPAQDYSGYPASAAEPYPTQQYPAQRHASAPYPSVPGQQRPPGATGPLLAAPEAAEENYARITTERAPVDPADISLRDLLRMVLDHGASDLHLTNGSAPMFRLRGELTALGDLPVLDANLIERMVYTIITQRQREQFEAELELDLAYTLPGLARFRVNVYKQRNAIGAAFRLIPFEIKQLEDLGVPASVAAFASLPRGFVLVTGPTGSGKSTTLAALIDLCNRTRHDHILTVEDPIEFLHEHKSCLVNQREVGDDTHSFSAALKHALRQDPDIILVGELRDLETISVALTAAETGHLVFATLHTQDAPQTIDRLIDVFPAHQQQQVRVQLAGALQGVVTQTLCRTADGQGRAVATEVMVATPGIRNLIREGKTHQIYSAMQAGSQHGMHTLDQHLADLVRRNRITYEVALEKCHSGADLDRLLGKG